MKYNLLGEAKVFNWSRQGIMILSHSALPLTLTPGLSFLSSFLSSPPLTNYHAILEVIYNLLDK